ncbi:hypothetical protein ASPCADRAFT_517002, partial [Aspergillus carbonarius ITEM 5010]
MKRWYSLYDSLSDISNFKRSLAPPPGKRNEGLPKICDSNDNCLSVPKSEYEEFQSFLWSVGNATQGSSGELIPRARAPKICDSKKKTLSKFKTKSYPNVGTLSNSRQFFGVVKSAAKSAICNGLPVTLGQRVLGTNYVIEHVTELQTPAQFATSMLSG